MAPERHQQGAQVPAKSFLMCLSCLMYTEAPISLPLGLASRTLSAKITSASCVIYYCNLLFDSLLPYLPTCFRLRSSECALQIACLRASSLCSSTTGINCLYAFSLSSSSFISLSLVETR